MRTSSRLISAGRPASVLLAVTITLGLLGGLVTVGQSSLISRIVNAVFLEGATTGQLTPVFVASLGLIGLRAALSWGSEFSAFQAALRIKLALRRQLFKHLYAIGPAVLLEAEEEQGRSGELVNTMMQGVEALEAYYSQYLPQLALSALVPLTMLVFLMPLDPLTGLILLLTAPLLPLFMYLIGSSAKVQTRRQWLGLSRMSAYFLDVFQGLTTLKGLGCSREQAATIDQVSDSHRRATMSVLRITFLSALALEMIATISTAVVAVETGLRLLYGRLAFEQAFFILLLAPEFYLPLRMLGLRFHAGMAGVEAAKRIFEILDMPAVIEGTSESGASEHGSATKSSPPAIRFEKVNFQYADGRMGLQNASFDIPAGKVTVLAGESGAGKSTIFALLLRFLEAQSGSILVKGKPLGEIPRQVWYQQVAWMPQRPYLFQDSLAANISLGKAVATEEEIQEAARQAQADEFIQSFPEKYATQIGERGVRLSAGQAHRIGLARTFLHDAPLLLLDEPGAHLDPDTEAQVRESIRKLVQGRTVVIASHRPPAFLKADQVIWLEKGAVKRIEQPGEAEATEVLPARKTEQSMEVPAIRLVSEIESASPEQTTSTAKIKQIGRLIRLLAPFSGRAALSVLLGFFTVGSSMGLMATAAALISRAALQPSIAELQVAIVGVRFFGLSRGVFRYLERLVTHDVTFRVLGKLRGWFYRAVEPLVPARTQQRHSGDLLQRVVGDISALEDFYVRAIAPPLVAILSGAAACMLLAWFSPRLTIYLLVILSLCGVGLPALIVWLNRMWGGTLVKRRAALTRCLVDGIQGMADVLASGQGERQLTKMQERSRQLGEAQSKLAAVNGLQASAGRLLADIGMIGILWLGAEQVRMGNLDGVLLGALMLLAFSSFEAFLPLPQAAQHLSNSLAAAGRLFEIADARPEVREPAKPVPIPADLNIEVSDLSFGYPEHGRKTDVETLAHISFSLTPGKKIALVGTSGAGKSTLFNLLLRFWDGEEGKIQLNQTAYHRFSGDGLRKQMAVLPQNPALFSASIWDNLRLAQPKASREEIEQAARRAKLHEWIASLPNGYQTWVGEAGIKLSGGQRQRMALARTLLRKSPLYLLDEPTSQLDPDTEWTVLQGILETVKENQAALLLITHRLVGLEQMDEILVLNDGRIVERGRHSELRAKDGYYQKLCEMHAQL